MSELYSGAFRNWSTVTHSIYIQTAVYMGTLVKRAFLACICVYALISPSPPLPWRGLAQTSVFLHIRVVYIQLTVYNPHQAICSRYSRIVI